VPVLNSFQYQDKEVTRKSKIYEENYLKHSVSTYLAFTSASDFEKGKQSSMFLLIGQSFIYLG
ncbi:MAG: hypothetical protein WBD99_03670, partial [Thermodesulfobacteriota bacterium]